MTQNQWLLSHFNKGRTITTLQAHRAGICRLSERCRELESAGHKISRERVKVKSRFGGVVVVRYGLR